MSESRLGRYEIQGELGRGGMSVVYRAADPNLERPVAIKVLHPHLANRADARTRFTREAKAVARLHHKNIVEVYDYAPPDSERAYIVTEFIDGPTLRAFVEDHPIEHGELAALLMIPIFEALAHAHSKGIVHRDVKPENIMIRANGTPVLMDFGIAQMVDTETLTATGTMLGSPAHMAPEIVEGEPITISADIFSGGTVLYSLVCGALPFSGPTPAALFRRILETRFDPVLQRRPHASRTLARLIERCLQRHPAERPTTAASVADALRALLEDAGITAIEYTLAQYTADPEVFQDALPRTLVPRYLTAAQAAFDAGLTARALDFINRVLGLDEDNEPAQALLARIERGRRRGKLLWLSLAALLLVGVAGAAVTWWPTSPETLPISNAPDTVPARASALDQATAAQPADATRPAAPDAQVPDAAPVPDAAQVAALPDAGRPARPRPRRPRRPVSVAVATEAPKLAPPVRVPVKGGAYKNTKVSVNGHAVGYIFEIETQGGLRLRPGRHVFKFTSPACAPFTKAVVVEPNTPRGPTVAFECKLRPAIIHIIAKRELNVRDPKGRIIGRTNQDVPYQMRARYADLRLTVGDPGDRLPTLPVRLVAGQRQKVRLKD
jgi:serine/threonine-protein kinase